MTHTVTNIEANKWLVSVSFEKGCNRAPSNTVIGTEAQAAYAPTLAGFSVESRRPCSRLLVVEEHDHMEEMQ